MNDLVDDCFANSGITVISNATVPAFRFKCVQKITEAFTLRASMISRSSRVCSVDIGLNRNSSRIKRSIFWYALITFFSVPSPCATPSSFNKSGRDITYLDKISAGCDSKCTDDIGFVIHRRFF